MGKLENKKIVMFTGDMYEDLELWYPKIRLEEEGAEVVVAGSEKGETFTGKNGLTVETDISFDEVNTDNYDALVLPGGYGPDKVRRHSKAIEHTKQMFDDGKLIAFICHAGWIPASADILKGMKVTSFFSIKDDLIHAGAEWVDEPVVIDKNLISSRHPGDLTKFCPAIITYLSK